MYFAVTKVRFNLLSAKDDISVFLFLHCIKYLKLSEKLHGKTYNAKQS